MNYRYIQSLNGPEDILDLNVVMGEEIEEMSKIQGISYAEASKIWNAKLSAKAELGRLIEQAAILDESKHEAVVRDIGLEDAYDLWKVNHQHDFGTDQACELIARLGAEDQLTKEAEHK